MNEYDQANFNGIYEGKNLVTSAAITTVPWEIGEAQPIVCQILEKMKPCSLLDVGCGLGRNSKAASDLGYNVTAIDTSENAIIKCKKLHSNLNISFKLRDACDTKFSKKFDIILDSATYHAIPSDKRIDYLTEMRRLASDNTVFHIITFAPSLHGMPKPLANELSEIAALAEKSKWFIKSVERVEYNGNAVAIEDFCKKKGLNIQLNNRGRTRLPSWHLVLVTDI